MPSARAESPEQVAARLMAPAATSAYWSFDQVKDMIIEAVREERGEVEPKPARRGKPE
jgi:hypothetical protein